MRFIPRQGFDYAHALRELQRTFSYEEIAAQCGFASKSSVARIIAGSIPDHPMGEAIYVLYFETFKRKPPELRSEMFLMGNGSS